MRTLWNAITFLAVVNLLALLIVVGWLWQSGRLTSARAYDIRSMLSTTVGQASEEAGRLATEAEAERLRQQEELAREHPAADAPTQISQIALVHQQSVDARRRLDDERQMLASQLHQATTALEAKADAWQRSQADTSGMLAADAQRKSDEQFLRAVKQLEQIPAKQAKRMLETLVSEKKVDQAVAYLDAMNPRAASKVLREFKADSDIALATELLERLRTRGVAQADRPPAPDTTGQAAPGQTDSAHAAARDGDNLQPDAAAAGGGR